MKNLKKLINSILDTFEGLSENDKLKTINSPLHSDQWMLLFKLQAFVMDFEKALKDPTLEANGDYARGYRDCLKDLKGKFEQ